MSPVDAEKMLDLIVKKAPGIRAAGISHVNLDGVAFTLVEMVSEASGDAPDEPAEDLSPLSDPETFGMRSKKGQVAQIPSRGGKS